jgi:hypothetical protein
MVIIELNYFKVPNQQVQEPITGAGQTNKKGNSTYCSELLSFWTLSIVQYSKKLENTTYRKLGLFPSSGRWEGGRTPSQLGPLERANFNHRSGHWSSY